MDHSESAEIICRCYDEMSEVLLETEIEISGMFTCPPDDLDVAVERINQYREITDEISAEIDAVCAEDESGELKKAVMPQTDRKDVPDELVPVFEKRQEIITFKDKGINNVDDQYKKRTAVAVIAIPMR